MPSRSRLARLLQSAFVFQLALAGAWIAWRWLPSPLQAVAGAVVILFIAPIVLAFEFAIVSRVSRTDTAPVPTAAQLARAWLSETRQLFRTFYFRQPFRWRAEPDHLPADAAGRTGVVLVHGFMCNRGFWNAWMRALRDRGTPFVAVNLEPVYAPIDDYAGIVDEAVQRVLQCTGRPPLIVSHSMGGLAVRAWWRQMAARRPVAHLVTIATPHRGTWLARFSRSANTRQMKLRGEWVWALAEREAVQPLPPATCWYSNCDNVVFPASTATLPSADNRFIPGEPHVALAFHPEVRRACLALLDALDAPSR